MNKICCNKQVQVGTDSNQNNQPAIFCAVCEKYGTGKTLAEAIKAFDKSPGKVKTENQNAINTELAILPKSPEQLPQYISDSIKEITSITAPFLQAEKPALMRMLKLNMKYVMQNKDARFIECWKTKEGQQSIIDAMDEAYSLGATLPAMGSIVPFGGVVEFIPAVEAFEFALTTGKTAPFTHIRIDPIYPNQQYECFENKENGSFEFRFKSIMIPAGDIAAVVVRAKDKQGNKTGRIYSTEQLIAKAERHSKSYKTYLLMMQSFQFAKSEGLTEADANGREFFYHTVYNENAAKYFEQDVQIFKDAEAAGQLKGAKGKEYVEVEMPKKGGTWTKKITRAQVENPAGIEKKKIYPDELQNPYDGPDRPEMMRKTAGKSFFSPFIKVRNSVAAMDEIRESKNDDIDSMIDASLNTAMDNLEGDFKQDKPGENKADNADIQDAEFEVEGERDPAGQESEAVKPETETEESGERDLFS